MGIPIMDIHAPSVSPTSTSSSVPHPRSTSAATTKSILLSLIQRKDALEAELKALGNVLDSHGVTMSTPLTTFDGFPRADVDVAQIRVTRARIIPLRNDYKALMAEIEKGLHEHHAAVAAGGADGEGESRGADATSQSTQQQQQLPEDVVQLPFARVNSVMAGGPAEEAGLRVGDVVKRFGAVTALNHNRLSRVAQEVEQNEGRVISVLVSRKDEVGVQRNVTVVLTPRSGWGGRGMLGCHLLPL